MKFDEIIWFTDRPSGSIPGEGIAIVEIPTITTRDEYSRIIVNDIAKYISTEQVLITQTDGFIYNAEAWDPLFEASDYIGAPWWYFPFNHVEPHPASGPRTCVGNGGFSLRSTRLCNAVTELAKKPWPIEVPEDLFICRTLRPELEKMGMTWAPEHLAHRFCCEDRPYEGQFGVHGHETFKLNTGLVKP